MLDSGLKAAFIQPLKINIIIFFTGCTGAAKKAAASQVFFVEVGHVFGIAILKLGRYPFAGVYEALAGLGPARVRYFRVDVGPEVVFGRGVAPEGGRLLCQELDLHDGLDAFEAVFPGRDEADGGTMLFGQFVAVDAGYEKG